ncbi:acetyl-CoA carboxylase biotin carboxylase subunit family protein [Streptomyces sp. NBC_01518]|uniref:ATP-grasp domain-containing protein n=1 Tax=Streptomyces sp. NBC_01518 TaxID=2903891 RepID=UPI00386BEEC1
MTLAVVFEEAAATAGELVTALESCGDVVFAIGADDPYARRFEPLLSTAGTVLTLSGDTRADADRLRAAGVRGIMPIGDWGVGVAAGTAAELGLPFNSPDCARALTDKHTQRTLLDRARAGGPGHMLVRTPADWDTAVKSLALPLVVKPSRGRGSRNTRLVHTAEAGRDLVTRLLDATRTGHEPALVAEEYLTGTRTHPFGDYVSVESVCRGTSVRHLGVTGKLPLVPPFRETGQFLPAALPAGTRREVEELTEVALRALGVRHGVTHTEIKLTDRGPRIIEVNGRLGGNLVDLYRRGLGLDMIQVAARAALGQPLPAPDPAPAGRTVFQYYSQPPLDAAGLTAVRGVRSFLPRENIDSYSQFVRPGSELPGDLRSVFLDRVAGTADSPRAVDGVLAACLPELEFTFAGPDGETVVDAAALRELNSRAGARRLSPVSEGAEGCEQ